MKFIPPYISAQVASNAEKRFFRSLRNSADLEQTPLGDWVCLHSVNLPEHEYKRMGEIDFLLIGPPGVFVLEVKGGRVARENGVWEFTDRYGRVSRKPEGPFDQAKSAMFSLRNRLESDLSSDLVARTVFGYGVAFPDIEFSTGSTEWSEEMILDRPAIQFSIFKSLVRLAKYWRSKERQQSPVLTKAEIAQFTKAVRPDFDLVPKPGIRIGEVDAELVRLTGEQMRTLDAVESNPRILMEGSAGTGKTLLAMEVARRRSAEGRKVTFITFNPVLARYLDKQLRPDGVRVTSVHNLMRHIVRMHGSMPAELIPALDVEDPAFPHHLAPAFTNACRNLDDQERAEYLIVDETQDLIEQDYLLGLEHYLVGGLSEGRWLLCHDNERQSLRGEGEFSIQLDLLRDVSTQVSLTKNCRNTREIIFQTEMFTAIDAGESDLSSRISVTQVYYRSRDHAVKELERFIRQSMKDGIAPGAITLLSHLQWSESIASDLPADLAARTIRLSSRSPAEFDRSRITFARVQDFKGLENTVVAILDIDDLSNERRPSLYVAMTRARVKLWMAIDRRVQSAAIEIAMQVTRGT